MASGEVGPAYTGEIVDAHHHLWDLRAGHYPWLQDEYDPKRFFLGNYESLCHDYLPLRYRDETRGYRIIATVHIEAERSRAEQVEETRWAESLRRSHGMPAAIVGHVFFTQPNRDEVLAAHAETSLLRGIRSKPVVAATWGESVKGQPGTMQDEAWLAGLASLERFALSWDARVPFWHLRELAETVRQTPRVPVVVNHAGLPLNRSDEGLREWRAGLEAVARNENAFIKLSEFGLGRGTWDELVIHRIVRDCVAIFGFDRVMFGSNLPVSSLSGSFDRIVRTITAALSDATDCELGKLFAGTARRFYRIAEGPPSE